jgi:predicted outer membrane repeat protein
VTFDTCTFTKNYSTGDQGGGALMFQDGPTANVTNCTFTENRTDVNGGAIRHNSGTLTVSNSEFNENTAASGNAIHGAAAVKYDSGCTFNGSTSAAGQVSGKVSLK